MSFAMLRLHNRAQAEDAVHDALLAAIEGLDRFAGDAALGTWLTGILKHKIADCLRRAVREVAADVGPDEVPAERAGPEEAAWRGALLARLDRELAGLPRRAARVFVMRDALGMSAREACGELAISAANCAVLLHRARRRLRARLAAEGIGSAA
jgi:RNA polymerase sigma-70 factor (ECF subfamily)